VAGARKELRASSVEPSRRNRDPNARSFRAFFVVKEDFTMNDQDQLYAMRHSLAHIMATAIQELHPMAKFGVGPVVEHGFYYDVDLKERLSEDDLTQIEHKMKEIIKSRYTFEHSTMSLADAITFFESKDQIYKVQLLNDLKDHGTTSASEIDREQMGVEIGESKVSEVSIYTDGPFTDLCRGPHVETTGQVGAFKLMRVSGAYWRGDEKNAQLQRIYGVGFTTKDELHKHLLFLKEAEARDHRKLGKELDLFTFSPLIGSGLPLFTPRGTVLRNELIRFSEEVRAGYGFERVFIPHIAKINAYKTSGHLEKFPELMQFTSLESGDALALKPVNCPHHTQLYASRPRSYRELPIRYMETTTVYRDERSGELGGLNRVRAITQDDSHVFATEDQVEGIFADLIASAQTVYGTMNLQLSLNLSFRDESDSYLGSKEQWDVAEKTIESLANTFELEYEVNRGEAAIYGPKMDFMAKDALGRKHQLATVQLDNLIPERFGLEYTASDGSTKCPVMVHCAILGSVERFLAVYIEHVAGAFPTWLAPEQVRLAPVNDTPELLDYAHKLRSELKGAGIRVHIDESSESVGKKIRAAGLAKVPYTIVLGDKERDTNVFTPRLRMGHGAELGELSLSTFIDGLTREIIERRSTSVF
jgi:threonyl-tRNA synthetase